MVVLIKPVRLISFCFLAMLLCCKSTVKQDIVGEANKTGLVQGNQEKLVLHIDSFVVYDPFGTSLVQKPPAPAPTLKLFTYIDVSCSSCLKVFTYLDSLSRHGKASLFEPYVICYAKDNFLYFKYLYEDGKIPRLNFPLYFDGQMEFYKQNPRMISDYYNNLVITNQQHMVIHRIDPSQSKGIDADLALLYSLKSKSIN